MKKNVFFILFSAFFCVFLSAQSADSITKVLDAKTVTFNEAAYFAVAYLGLDEDMTSFEDAPAILKASVPLPKFKNFDGALRFKEFAYICASVWNIGNGLNYRIFKSPRYALRDLKALRFVPPFTDPDAYVNGREMLYIMTKCAQAAEGRNTKEKSEQNIKGRSK